jgi:hypothetical protein
VSVVKSCRNCRRAFHPAADHHRLCWACWHEQRDDRAQHDQYSRGYANGWSDGERVGFRNGHEAGLREGATVLAPELLGDAIRLTHPDRHPAERFEMANRVTAGLIEMRDSVREGAR